MFVFRCDENNGDALGLSSPSTRLLLEEDVSIATTSGGKQEICTGAKRAATREANWLWFLRLREIANQIEDRSREGGVSQEHDGSSAWSSSGRSVFVRGRETALSARKAKELARGEIGRNFICTPMNWLEKFGKNASP